MAQPVKIPLPAILLANDFLDGDVVFRTATGWTRDPSQAFVAHNEADAAQLETEAKVAFAKNEVVDAALVDVVVNANGWPVPCHFRERFKVSGPSHRRDLGKQALYPRGATPFTPQEGKL